MTDFLFERGCLGGGLGEWQALVHSRPLVAHVGQPGVLHHPLPLLNQFQQRLAVRVTRQHCRWIVNVRQIFRAEVQQDLFCDEPVAGFVAMDAITGEEEIRIALPMFGEVTVHRAVQIHHLPAGFALLRKQPLRVTVQGVAIAGMTAFHLIERRGGDEDDFRARRRDPFM